MLAQRTKFFLNVKRGLRKKADTVGVVKMHVGDHNVTNFISRNVYAGKNFDGVLYPHPSSFP
jgi:hypothetical protein